MKSKLDHALELAAVGFWVFRIVENGKTPVGKGWQMEATRDPASIRNLFEGTNYNIGIFASKFGDDKALTIIDEDNKNGKNGRATLFKLDFEGSEVPKTRVQTTPTGGRHYIYVSDAPVNQGGAGVLGDGLDLRSRGGYIVGAGSTIDGKAYTSTTDNIAIVPAWLYERQTKEKVAPKKRTLNVEINQERALARARKYLAESADSPEEGGRNEAGFRVCCEIKDLGVDEDGALELMYEWNGALESPMEDEEVQIITQSSYKTGKNEIGIKAPETMFDLVDKLPEVEDVAPTVVAAKEWELNDEYALVMTGGSFQIIRDTTNHKGEKTLMRWDESAFHKYFEYAKVKVITQHAIPAIGQEEKSKLLPLTKEWMKDKRRRTYDGFVFSPNKLVDKRWYNLWQGFSCKPLQPGERISERGWNAFKMWKEHAFLNICQGNEEYFKYQIGYLAHMVQKTWEKPLVACVYKGGKGVGKNAFLGRVTDLFGPHYRSTANERYVGGNFNSHMEGIVPFVLDEATWAGDKKMKGCVQDIITNPQLTIERKGFDSYVIDNFVRAFFTSNEAWVVDASDDERRYFILEVGKGRQQDTAFFEEMRVGMQEHEGGRALLTYLMDYDLTGFNVNRAPNTNAMASQKFESLSVFGQFWLDSLKAGTWVGSPVPSCPFTEVEVNALSTYLKSYAIGRGIGRQLPNATAIGIEVFKFSPGTKKIRVAGVGARYRMPGLEKMRKEFEKYINGAIEWDEEKGELLCLT